MATATTAGTTRVRSVVPRPEGGTLLATDDGDVVVAARPDAATGRALLAGVRHAAWVHLEVGGGDVAGASFGGATRVPVVRHVPAGAALHLAASGVPTYLTRVRVAA